MKTDITAKVLSAGISTKLLEKVASRLVSAPGLLIAASGMYWLSHLSVESSYAGYVLPGLFITYFGLGMGFMPLTLTAVHNVAEEWAGVASAVLNTSQQIGAALGVSVLATISTFVTNKQLPEAPRVLQEGLEVNNFNAVTTASDALTAGYTTAFLVGSAMLVFAALIVGFTVITGRIQSASEASSEGKPVVA